MAPPTTVMSSTQDAGRGAAAGAFLATAQAALPRREIIYTGEMTVEVDDVEAAARQVEKTVLAAGGWVAARQLNTDSEGHRTATIEIRVPAASFMDIHDALRKIGEIIHDAIQSQDVGKEFVDLEARLRNLEREETVIAGLFDRKGKIAEVLEVERELARVRGEIEQIRGHLRYLMDQVANSALKVKLAPKRPAIERKMESWNLGYHVLRAWRTLVAVARAITYFVIYAIVVVIPLALFVWGTWKGVRAVNRRRSRPD